MHRCLFIFPRALLSVDLLPSEVPQRRVQLTPSECFIVTAPPSVILTYNLHLSDARREATNGGEGGWFFPLLTNSETSIQFQNPHDPECDLSQRRYVYPQ